MTNANDETIDLAARPPAAEEGYDEVIGYEAAMPSLLGLAIDDGVMVD